MSQNRDSRHHTPRHEHSRERFGAGGGGGGGGARESDGSDSVANEEQIYEEPDSPVSSSPS